VDQPFDTFLELDERAVIREGDHLAVHFAAERVTLDDVAPGIGRLLLVSEGHALGLRVELQNDDFDLIADVEVLRRMIDAAPTDVGDVQQAIDAAEVHEDAVIGDVLDDTVCDLALFEPAERLVFLRCLFDFHDGAPRKNDVAALLVERHDLELVLVAFERIEVLDRLRIDQ